MSREQAESIWEVDLLLGLWVLGTQVEYLVHCQFREHLSDLLEACFGSMAF